jgi:hypothetical protein
VLRQHKLQAISIVIGAGYGLLMRGLLFFRNTSQHVSAIFWVMSVAFVIVVPYTMGYLTVAVPARKGRVGIAQRIFAPWLTVLLVLGGCILTAWEGTICVVMMAPIALLLGSLGGLTAAALVDPANPALAISSMVLLALLPFVVGWTESKITLAPDVRTVESETVIHASPEVVWRNIERVPAIVPGELPKAWNRTIGFPRPVEATLSHEGVGGIRHATFSGNVLFIETIDTWEPGRNLGFSIRADADDIPSTTMDDHVRVGGPYFDVLRGEYVLEAAGDGATRLRLISRHKVATDFNWYAHLWTDAVMRDVQRSILYVIKNRCENSAVASN